MEAARSRHAVKDHPPWKTPFPTLRDRKRGRNFAVSPMQNHFALFDCRLAKHPTVERSYRSHSGHHSHESYLK